MYLAKFGVEMNSVAIPLIGAGQNGLSRAEVASAIVNACGRFVIEQRAPRSVKKIALVGYSEADYEEYIAALTQAFNTKTLQNAVPSHFEWTVQFECY